MSRQSKAPPVRRQDMVGRPYGMTRVLAVSERPGYVLVECACGVRKDVNASNLLKGQKSCGCQKNANPATTHGQSRTTEYKAWKNLKKRCREGPNAHPRYAGRGISVCPRWRDSFEAFLEDMGPMPAPGLTVERRDNSLGYGPDNCLWADRKTQARNRDSNLVLELDGRRQTLAAWAEETGIGPGVIRQRIFRDGWTTRAALTVRAKGVTR